MRAAYGDKRERTKWNCNAIRCVLHTQMALFLFGPLNDQVGTVELQGDSPIMDLLFYALGLESFLHVECPWVP